MKEGKFDEALAVIRERIPFPSICGHACYRPCEMKCGNRQFGDSIAIRALKRAAVELGGDLWRKNLTLSPASGKRVAVVGSGPSGLTAAYYLATLGHKVKVLEALEEPGGMMRYGIPKYRLPRKSLDKEISYLQDIGVEIETNRRIESVGLLFQEGYHVVYLACGAHKGAKLGIAGEDLPGVIDGISFLKEVNRGNTPVLGNRVAVIGGGNTAVDAARCAARLGAGEITIIYRRSQVEMTAYEEEVGSAVFEGIRMQFLAAPARVVRQDDGLELSLLRMELGKPDNSGRRSPVPVKGSEYTSCFDTVIVAIGQVPVISDTIALKVDDKKKTAIVEPETLQTNLPRVFAGGDMVSGPASIIEAIAYGRKAASSIDKYLGGTGAIDQQLAPAEEEVLVTEYQVQEQSQTMIRCAPLTDRVRNFQSVESGLNEEMAVKEAQRCRSCDARQFDIGIHPEGCKECGYCIEVCGRNVFEVAQKFNNRGYRPITVRNREKCVGCMLCFYACPDFSIDVTEKREA
jgi:NADPH-dependent glutamate synthase beta subunit-like oxidoreductase/NAD-dependent dihydropyrimidine dehydrogenase PreA subunit